jgi:hypothetical protein
MTAAEKLLAVALELPEHERAEIVARLLEASILLKPKEWMRPGHARSSGAVPRWIAVQP